MTIIIADSAFSMGGGQKPLPGPKGKLVVISEDRVSTKRYSLSFIHNVGNGALYYDKTLRKYIFWPSGTSIAVFML